MDNREKLSSRLGFILLSAGCAIGCGNVWKFPWMVGQNGGGGFVLLYIIFLLILGLPVMVAEFSMGRAAQASPVKMYQKLEKPGAKWHIHGGFALLGNVCLMAFYSVVTGWMLYYFLKFAFGMTADIGFETMIQNPVVNVVFLAVTVILCFGILCFNIQGGLERITKVVMIFLLGLMVVLAVRSVLLPGAAEGMKFYLLPDFKKITGDTVVAAMNQAFFTLSLGIGAMAIFGSYIDKGRSLLGESINIIALDTFVAITAGFIIFPSCFTYGVEVNSGPSLLFDTMATVFTNMEGGRVWGALFFLFMTFAALSTALAVYENILACTRELTGWSRKKGALICGTAMFLVALTTALGYSLWPFHPFGPDSAWLDFWDFIVSYNLLPIGSILFIAFCCNKRYGWGFDNFMSEANAGEGPKIKPWMKPIFAILVPGCVLFLYVYGLFTFNWK